MSMASYAGPSTSDFEPDVDAAWSFLTWWFRGCTQGRVEVGWMDPSGRGLSNFRRFTLDDMLDVARIACDANRVAGQSVYVRASTVSTPDGTNTTDAHFVQAPGVWGDLDTPEQVERARTVETMVRPNASVITGRIPHLRAQNFFRTDVPITDANMVRSLNKRILALFGGDPSVVNPSRLMRLPGTIAWPWKPGRVVEQTAFVQPSDGRASSYPLALLMAQLPQEAAPNTGSSTPGGDRATLNSAQDLMRRIRAGDNWHVNMVRLVAHWIGRGWSNAEIQAAAESFTLVGYSYQQTAAEVAKAIEGGRRKWFKPDFEFTVEPEVAGDKPPIYNPWATLVPPEFPIHALPARLAAFVSARAHVIGVDPCGLAWAAISACSAAIHGQSRLQMKRQDNWKVPPAIWVALVGASSSKKTPAIKAAWGPLERLQGRSMNEWKVSKAEWKALPKKQRDELDEPESPIRFVTHGATIESIQTILSRQDRGLAVMHDELAGLIEGMDKYAGGKNSGDRAFYLQSYNGGDYVVDRVGRGTLSCNNLLTTICGGIQPSKLRTMTDITEDGMWQRFVPIIMQDSAIGYDEMPGPEDDDYTRMIEGMAQGPDRLLVQLTEGAHAVREEVEQEAFTLEKSGMLGGRFASFCGKMPGLWGRLCLVMSQMEGLPFCVSERTARGAQTLVFQSALLHAARITMDMGGDAGTEIVQGIAGYILSKGKTRVLAGELSRDVWACRKQGVYKMQQLVSPLVAGGWITPEQDHPGNTAWRVDPLVHELFADETRRELDRTRALRNAIFAGKDE